MQWIDAETHMALIHYVTSKMIGQRNRLFLRRAEKNRRFAKFVKNSLKLAKTSSN